MTVYILKNNYMCIDDGVCIDTIVGVYKDLKKAQKQMEQEIKNAKIDFKRGDADHPPAGCRRSLQSARKGGSRRHASA